MLLRYIMSSFMVGRLLSSFYCGVLADRIGRKFVIRMGLWSCVVLQLAFGVAPTFNIACLFRFLMGLFNGLTAVAKALLPELVPKAQQQSAMAYVTSMWTLGALELVEEAGLFSLSVRLDQGCC
jgi:MFS family permease